MAVTDVVSLDEFVDLYKILEIPQTATEAELRERVNKLYLEAQRNLDHHNFRKRFYFQQLYEVHLPQAHQLLLDSSRRVEYDQYLDAFNKGMPFPTEGIGQSSGGETGGELGRSDHIEADMLPTVGAATPPPAAPPKTPSKPAAPDQGGFAFVPEPDTTDLPPARAPMPSRPARPSVPAHTPASTTAPSPNTSTPAPARPVPTARPIPAAQIKPPAMDASEVERRRDYKRRELIKRELVSAGLTWGMGVGLGAFVVLGLILFVVMNQMKMTSNTNALIGGAAAVLFISAGAGRYALREARRRIVSVLSKMPYDELLRRCAR